MIQKTATGDEPNTSTSANSAAPIAAATAPARNWPDVSEKPTNR